MKKLIFIIFVVAFQIVNAQTFQIPYDAVNITTNTASNNTGNYWICPAATLQTQASNSTFYLEEFSRCFDSLGNNNTYYAKNWSQIRLLDTNTSNNIIWRELLAVIWGDSSNYTLIESNQIIFDYTQVVTSCPTSTVQAIGSTISIKQNKNNTFYIYNLQGQLITSIRGNGFTDLQEYINQILICVCPEIGMTTKILILK
jgi:hypothetical protein